MHSSGPPCHHSTNQTLIAAQLNISRTTVSRCFTNHPGISPSTRARVFSLASQLGYHYMQPKARPSQLPPPRASSIGVVVCSDFKEFNRTDYESPGIELIPGVSEFAQKNELQIDLQFVSPSDFRPGNTIYRKLLALGRKKWLGLILIYPFPANGLEELVSRFSCVSLVEQYSHTSLNCVDVDHHKGIRALMQYLSEVGHRRIGFLSRDFAVEPLWSFRRQSAYFEYLLRSSLPYRAEDVVVADHCDPERGQSAYDLVAERCRGGVTAWVCAADYQAYDLIHELEKRGFSVPGDVSVTGFDGIRRPPGLPRLTTMRIPYREIGYIGAGRLADLMSKRFYSVQQILLECTIEPGATVAAPPGRKTR